jgi:hypothetical protein
MLAFKSSNKISNARQKIKTTSLFFQFIYFQVLMAAIKGLKLQYKAFFTDFEICF